MTDIPKQVWVRPKVSDIDVYPATGEKFEGCTKFINSDWLVAELEQMKADGFNQAIEKCIKLIKGGDNDT